MNHVDIDITRSYMNIGRYCYYSQCVDKPPYIYRSKKKKKKCQTRVKQKVENIKGIKENRGVN